MNGLGPGRSVRSGGFYLRCALWGFATGAVTGVLFLAVVGLLDVLLLAVVLLAAEGLSSVATGLFFLVAGNVFAGSVLWPARTSLTRAWLDR